ncbi:MAG TPA: DUF2231 domain-containing protein [Candidatus Binatia bacterium]|nr:DUF2231 domain-containing protein [Candidatus Binatia bacterium]
MTSPQIHLMLNHLPVVGLLFVVVVLVAGLVSRNDAILRLAFLSIVACALAAIPVFLSGEPAEERVEHLAGVSESAIERHEDVAKAVTFGLEVLGLAAVAVLLRSRGRRIPIGLAAAFLAATLAWSGLLAWTAHLGGLVRHSEIASPVAAGGPAAPIAEPDED